MLIRSIRLRFMLLATSTLLLALGAASIAITIVFERQLKFRVAGELESEWNEVASVFAIDDAGQAVLQQGLADPRYRLPYSGLYWQISTAEGPVLRSRSLWDSEIAPQAVLASQSEGRVDEVTGPDNRALYLFSRNVKLAVGDQEKTFRLAVGLEQSAINAMRGSFNGDVLLFMGLIAAGLSISAWIQLGIGLRPLVRLRDELDRIRTGRTDRLRGPFARELEPLANDLNRLLDRQDGLIVKARDRAGTLAHGLKTPMTIISAEARKLERRGLDEAAAILREQIRIMNLHVQRELSRARTHGLSIGGGHLTDVGETVNRLIGLCRRMPRGSELTWSLDIPAGLAIRMEADDFGEVVGNLLDNARKWAENSVVVRATLTGEKVRFEVVDDGPGFSERIRSAAAERGVRGSEATESSGLGLSIVREVLKEYGGEFVIEAHRVDQTVVSFVVDGWLEAVPDGGRAERPQVEPLMHRAAPDQDELPLPASVSHSADDQVDERHHQPAG